MPQGANNSYFGDLVEGIKSSLKGLQVSFRHIRAAHKRRKPIYVSESNYFAQDTGMVTLRYPLEALPVPDHARYQLYNEMDDCIVCDKCAKICPVDCIDIEPIKSPEVIGHASDGSPIRLYAAKFDIDMAKCCFCGLCTTVCPTECLTMTKDYDFSTFDITQMNFAFGNLTPEKAEEKRALYEQFVKEKEALKAESGSGMPPSRKSEVGSQEQVEKVEIKKPAFKPVFKKPAVVEEVESQEKVEIIESQEKVEVKKPAFKPTFKKPAVPEEIQSQEKVEIVESQEKVEAQKPAFKPTFKKPAMIEEVESQEKVEIVESQEKVEVKKPAFKPTFKKPAVIEEVESQEKVEIVESQEKVEIAESQEKVEIVEVKKPAFKPTLKRPPQ
jgi:NADH-quinone oxidoreductase subunit I